MNGGQLRRHWLLDDDMVFLNHGSFGACPRAVLDEQQTLRERLERQPISFMVRELEPALDAVRAALCPMLGADPADLVFVRNATAAVGGVLSSLKLRPGDELLTFTHAYEACRNALRVTAERSGARVVQVAIPLPLEDADAVLDALMAQVTERTRFALVDAVTSPSAIVLPAARLVRALRARGVQVMVDAAHAPGMLPVNLDAVGADWTTGNCHKWLCAPKGAAWLHVRRDRHAVTRPAFTSLGEGIVRPDRSPLHCRFDWAGTDDVTALLSVPRALEVMAGLMPGGWPAILAHNRALVLQGRAALLAVPGVEAAAPQEALGSMATLLLPPLAPTDPSPWPWICAPQAWMWQRHRIEVPFMAVPGQPGRWMLRISAQLYNTLPEYQALAQALRELC